MLLVTGYKGFIGSFLYKKLSELNYEVRGFEWEDDLNLEKITTVIHLGAISSTTEKNVEKIMKQNVQFSISLLDKCIDNNINFQYASSASIYGKKGEFSETSPVDPNTPYAWSKYILEKYAEIKIKQNVGITIQGFRYFNVWSENGEDHKGGQSSPHFKFIKDAIEKKKITLFENSDFCQRDFIHVNDIVNYHLKFLKVKESGIWNLGNGKATSFMEIANNIRKKYDCELVFIPMPEHIKDSYQYYTCADMTKTNKTLEKI